MGSPADRRVSPAEDAALARAVELAEAVSGTTSPNPAVGAVILDAAGTVVGEGQTQPPGGDHAEVVALRQAGPRARGATVVVTLEPCSHTGRTPPCSDALLTAGVARVVYAVADPYPPAAGGAARLRGGGVQVLAADGAASRAAGRHHRPWLLATGSGRPYLTVKLASSLDGRAAAADGSTRWITSAAARADAHRVRARVDAILVGSGTVLADDPALTARQGGVAAARQPLRVVLDRRGRVDPQARVLAGPGRAWHLTGPAAELPAALTALYAAGVRHALVEGGPTLAGAVVDAGLADEVLAYLAPLLLGAGLPALAGRGAATLAAAPRFAVEELTRFGEDIGVRCVRTSTAGPGAVAAATATERSE